MLKVTNLTKRFQKKNIIENGNFFVEDNEVVGIAGNSGCGKSTIARILCGTINKDSGEIFYNDMPVYDHKNRYNRHMHKHIQLIPQQPFLSLDPKQTVGRAITEPILFYKMGGYNECITKTKHLLSHVWLEPDVLDMYPHQLSGGMCQRVVIARALGLSPGLIIADESTSMLDSSAQAQIIRLLHKLQTEQRLSILFISHDIDLMKALCNRIYLFENCMLSLK